MKALKNIVIVGAGYAGVLTAKKLAKRLKKQEDVQITIIDKNPFHTMYTELHEVAAHRVDEVSIKISLERIFAGRNVRVVLDSVLSIDFENRVLAGKAGAYPYDYLVLATGSKPAFFGVPGAEEISYTLWSYDDAVVLHEHLLRVFRCAAREADPAERRRLLTFYVVGAGFTGVEMAGELAELAPLLCEKFEIDAGEVSMFEVDVLDRIVPILPEKLSDKVARRLAKMGVRVRLETGVAGIGKDYIELKGEDGRVERFPAGTVIWTAGIESSDIVSEAAEALQTARRGRVVTDKYLRAAGHADVFVAGDNIMYVPKGEQNPVPQMVENCEQSAELIAHNLVSLVTGRGELREYNPKFHGVMVSVGGRYGVAQVGTPNHMFSLPSFLAMFVKHFINVVYFVQVLGWNKVFSYLKHEFFTIRDCRSFLGGHFSNRTPSFLLVPLRVWLGACWVFEGAMKIVEGWMYTPMLTGFFGGANQFFNQILSAAGARNAVAVVDAVASATAAAGEAVLTGVAVFSYRILGFLDVTLVSASDLTHATISDYAFKIDFPLVNWFVNHVILSSDGMQVFMQICVVAAEILIGLALIGGLFTFLTSGASLVLQVMFVMTTGLYLNTFWMVFAAIAVLIGGGRTIGLDYYVMPWLKKRWKNVRFVRKWYLYND
ncbi:NAD(P)/FAD-dependent oxidoreductase [Anaerotruncus sp. AF02-27]|nr:MULTISPECIES: NAD(P)/FAD-dependent oxidoreductase [Anaerotruncus]RGX52590.1 NAD(P)/FAD-dependent oxidoreductase [Anaerotruncus sp. AF02-27]